jgi:hypothetical protein
MPNITPPQILPNYVLVTGAYFNPANNDMVITATNRAGMTAYSDYQDRSWLLLPIETFPGLTKDEARRATGDARKVALGLVQAMHSAYAALPTAQRPTAMSIERLTPIAINETTIRQGFTFYFDLDIAAADVAAE